MFKLLIAQSLPESEKWKCAETSKAGTGNGSEDAPAQYDAKATEDAARELIIRDLGPFSATEKDGFERLWKTHCKSSLGRRFAVTKSFERLVQRCRDQIKQLVANRKARGFKFSMSCDAWKTKGRPHLRSSVIEREPEFHSNCPFEHTKNIVIHCSIY